MIEKDNTHFERPQAAEAALKGEEMPKAYIVVNAARRADMPASAAYLDRFRESLAHHGGRVLIGAEEIDRREG
jgi:hypothetical protein